MSANASDAVSKLHALSKNVGRVLIGKPDVIRLVLTGLLAGGHVLLEDVPGVGKTVLAKGLARSIRGDFRRVQFTPDLLPSDIVGVAVYDASTGAFELKPGPIFTNVLLADEINRATPRTQSALLEAMNDFEATVDRRTHALPRPFFVIATQNPYEFEGTYPLPESQLDRFLLRVRIGYPSLEDEKAVIRAQQERHPLDTLEPVIAVADVEELQAQARRVRVEEDVLAYVLAIARSTRTNRALRLGASPRAAVALTRVSQAHALLHGREYVTPDDVKALAVSTLAHRVISAGLGNEETDDRERIVRDLVEGLEVPL